jgi:hypothetical protein
MKFEIQPKELIKPYYLIKVKNYSNATIRVSDIDTISVKNLLISLQMLCDIGKENPADFIESDSIYPICTSFFKVTGTQLKFFIKTLQALKTKYNPENIQMGYFSLGADDDIYTILYYDEYKTEHKIKINFEAEDLLEISNHKVTYKIINYDNLRIQNGLHYNGLALALKFLDLEEGKLKQMLRSDNKEIFDLGMDLLKIQKINGKN